jgi:AraC-like DNA-binding protein
MRRTLRRRAGLGHGREARSHVRASRSIEDGWTASFEACDPPSMTDNPEVQIAPVVRRRSLPPWTIGAGSPGQLVLHLPVQGSFQLSRADGQVLSIEAGDVVGIVSSANDAGESAAGLQLSCVAAPLGASGIEPGEVLSLGYAAGRALPARLPSVIHLPASDVRREHALPALVSLLRAELASSSRERERTAQTLLDPLLAYTLRCWREARTGERGFQSPKPLDLRIARALAALRAEPARPWTVEALARAAGLSRAAFARRFLAELGIPPLRYLAEVRMQIASRLLVDSNDSLAGIAAQIGYESEFAFSRAFRRHQGEAPGVFRRRVRACPGAFTRTRAAA